MKNMKTRGQTLIEILITLLFIAASILALIKFQNYLAYSVNLTQQRSQATLIAASRLETLRDFQVLNTTSGYTDYQSIASGAATATVNATSYTSTWTVTAYTNPTYKRLDVTVSWTDRYGNAQSVRLINYVAGIDPQQSSAIM